MKQLRERIAVGCPVEDVEAGLIGFFEAREDAEGVTRMRLRVPMDGKLALEREVRFEAHQTRDEQNLNNLIEIAWQPEGTVMFPRFEGTLVVWGEDDPASSFVELSGHYTPPLGAAGQVFDEIIGFKIAQTTAKQFLAEIKREIEARGHFTKKVSNGG